MPVQYVKIFFSDNQKAGLPRQDSAKCVKSNEARSEFHINAEKMKVLFPIGD